MKSYSIALLFILSLLTFSCSDNLTNVGTNLQPSSDLISVGTDTFHVSTQNIFVKSMSSRQDSFLLGSFYDKKYGSTQADILAQVNCPVGFKYPEGAHADSAKLMLNYFSSFGDNSSPLNVNIYEMNKDATFDYSTPYPSNLDPALYTNRLLKLGERTFTAVDAAKIRENSVAIKLSDDFVQRFFPDTTKAYYTSDTAFVKTFFKGMYITTNLGTSTMLNIGETGINLYYYYHFNRTEKTISGKDTIIKTDRYKIFPANQEVRQINRFMHPDTAAIRTKLEVNKFDTVNYISSPANIQTRVNIPLARMEKRMGHNSTIADKNLVVNNAMLQVDVRELDEATLAQPIVKYLMLIKESAVDRFFNNKEVFSDTCALMGTFSSSQIGTTGVYKYYYTFDVATLVANEIKKAGQNNTTLPESLKMVLLPVRVTANSSGLVTAVKHQFLMSAVTIRSGNEIEVDPNTGKKVTAPMRIKVVYSGF